MKNTYVLNIHGTSFAVRSDEPEEYIRHLEAEVSQMIEDITNGGASSHKAALFVCMELADRLEKQKKNGQPKNKKTKKPPVEEVIIPDKNQVSLFEVNRNE